MTDGYLSPGLWAACQGRTLPAWNGRDVRLDRHGKRNKEGNCYE